MKKILMTLAAVAVATTMNAQLYVGGSFGIQGGTKTSEAPVTDENTGYTYTLSTDDKTFKFELLPEIGYKLNDNMAIGTQIGVVFNKNTTPQSVGNIMQDVTAKGFTFKFAPYFRYYFAQWEKVGLFFDAQLGLGFGSTTSDRYYWVGTIPVQYDHKVKNTEVSFAIVPGVSYQASEKVSIVAKLGNGLGYWFTKTTTPQYATINGVRYSYDAIVKDNTFGLNLKTLGLTVGVYYNF